jgi:potassium-dependent mechanosensitive channel
MSGFFSRVMRSWPARGAFLALLTALALIVASGRSFAQDEPLLTLETIQAAIESLERRVALPGVDENGLAEIRRELAPLDAALRAVIEEDAPKRNAIEQRLKQLGDPPAAGAPPESDSVANERTEQKRQFAAIEDRLKLATLLKGRADRRAASGAARWRFALARPLR